VIKIASFLWFKSKNVFIILTFCRLTLCRTFDPLSFDPVSFDPVSFDPLSFDPGSFDPLSVNSHIQRNTYLLLNKEHTYIHYSELKETNFWKFPERKDILKNEIEFTWSKKETNLNLLLSLKSLSQDS